MRWVNVFHLYQPPQWNAAVIRKVARESYVPLTAYLTRHPRIRITLNLTGSLTEQLDHLGFHTLLRSLSQLGRRGQVEFLGSAMYHPILPLIPEAEVRHQVRLNTATNRRLLGAWYRPRGFFPPEMAIDPRTCRTIARLGFRYILADDIAARRCNGCRQPHIHRVQGTKLAIVLRNRGASNHVAFAATTRELTTFTALVAKDQTHATLITAMDGENLGHHRRATASFWYRAMLRPEITSSTVSAFLTTVRPLTAIQPLASSWSTTEEDLERGAPFPLWADPRSRLHRLQWQLATLVLRRVRAARRDPGRLAASHALDQALASDAFWWASMRPWWSVEIVEDGALRWLTTLAYLREVRENDRERIIALVTAIIRDAQHQQATGAAARQRLAYLRKPRERHFFGGRHLTAHTLKGDTR